jgi:hypothetical protein
MNGTSMACPHVAGACALLLSKKPSLSHDDIFNLLTDNADHVPQGGSTWPNPDYGWGRLNCLRAIDAVPQGNQPNLLLTRAQVTGDNNGNGRLDPGETGNVITYLRNSGSIPATSLTGRLRTTDTYVTISDSLAAYGTVNNGDSANNASDVFTASASSGCPQGHVASFSLYLACSETTFNRTFSLTIGEPPVVPGTIIWGPKAAPGVPSAYGLYGLGYDWVHNVLYATYHANGTIYKFSGDSDLTALGTIPTPNGDTGCHDIKYSAYDNTLWLHDGEAMRVYKLALDGTVLRYFPTPANNYPTGLAFDGMSNKLYLADRKNSGIGTIFCTDTLGNQILSFPHPKPSPLGPRCLAVDNTNSNPQGRTLINLYTWCLSGAPDSFAVYEMDTATGQIYNSFDLTSAWNSRGIEYDPRDGSYWIGIMQNLNPPPPNNSIAKVTGFHSGMGVGVSERPGTIQNEMLWVRAKPNPFRAGTMVTYNLPASQKVAVRVYDPAGREVRTLFQGTSPAGEHGVNWTGVDNCNRLVNPGIYFVRCETANSTAKNKLIFLK